ncbi:hypothetical protein [Stenotrophomonas sp.]|uniref:hypothetical protein n=1 Tax=Stenotrophomonas sp. TaxID=69392 RepID=UPI0028B08FA3|nr:hypothetical protein [Stenotrophomonas sp.]
MHVPDNWFDWLLWLFFEQGLGILWLAVPIWWPALRVALQRGRIPHPFAFITISAALSYGFVGAVYLVAILPLQAVGIFLVPQMLEAGIAGGAQLQGASKAMTALLFPLSISLPFIAIFGSLSLNRRWRALCGHDVQETTEHR